ncbi:site-specific DNA-methyltransferase [Alteribacillus sp. YIM 98480]|uniref:DNA-methyltransferase n=1 Tax=Alteribacillus sp. YIM 98480 TaxID=2606599 RepID=UPI00131B8027|nr:site-specific DNA-methyltransferase [Alteribacillus sp. YIM 98480]
MFVSEKRNYLVKTTADAKEITKAYLKYNNISENFDFGLPEIDDRYHVWRVPIIRNSDKEAVAYIIIDAKDGTIDEERSTKVYLLKKKLNEESKIKKKKKETLKKYPISPLNNMIIHGDSSQELDKLPENSIDLVFTSPPYYNARPEYNEYASYEEYLEQIRLVIRKTARVLVEGRFFVMNVSPVLIPRASRNQASKRIAVPFDMHRLFIEEGFEFMDDIQWKKPEGAGWASGRGRRFSADRNPLQYKPVPVTENILVYRKKTDKLIDWYIRNHPNKEIVEDSKVLGEYDVTNIWEISPARDKRHRAIFPKELANKVIKYYSFKNDVVLDPFAGIGTVGQSAIDLERRFVTIEKEQKYVEGMMDDFHKFYFDKFFDIEYKVNKEIKQKYHLEFE